MGYQVSKSGSTYRIQFQVKGACSRTVMKGSPEALGVGLRPEMTFEEARVRARSLRAKGKVKEQVLKAGRTTTRLETARLLTAAYFPEEDLRAFESYCMERSNFNESHWLTAQDILRRLARDPMNWGGDNSEVVYAKMVERRGISPNYAKKIRQYLNRFGKFISKRNRTFYDPILKPSTRLKRELEKNRKRASGKSDPIRPYMLEEKKAFFSIAQYHWLYVSIWLGLRPREVDNLQIANRDLWYWGEEKGKPFLRIFQEKLDERGVDELKCWKGLPITWSEQEILMSLITEGSLERPANTLIQKVFGSSFTCYGGRKGFVSIIMERLNDLRIAQAWMGHQSIVETQRTYEENKDVRWAKVA